MAHNAQAIRQINNKPAFGSYNGSAITVSNDDTV